MVVEAFQARFAEDVFARNPRDPSWPMYLEVWLLVPEGNAKTTLVAVLLLYQIRFDLGAYIPVAASSREQAEELYRAAEEIVFRTEAVEPSFRRIFKCQEGYRRIKCLKSRGRIQVRAADDRTGDGARFSKAVVEELHRHHDLKLYRTWRGKVRKRRGQVIAISTAGEPGSEFEQTRKRMLESATDVTRETCFTRAAKPGSFVIHDYAVPAKANVEDMAVVKAANPLSAITIATLREDRASPTMIDSHWQRFKCNRAARSEHAAITESEWAGAATDVRIPEGQPIAVGLDAAWKWDTFAIVPLWVRDAKFRLLGAATVLVPPRDGTSLHPDGPKEALRAIHRRNPIHTVVMDMTRAEEIAAFCRDEFGAEVIDHSQGNAQAALDFERFMDALRVGWIRHTGDAALARHVLNAVARELPDKKAKFERPAATRQTRDRLAQEARVIDALDAAAMVHSEAAAELISEEGESWAESAT